MGLQWLEHRAIAALDLTTPAGVAAKAVLQIAWGKMRRLKAAIRVAEQGVATLGEAREAVMQWRGRQQIEWQGAEAAEAAWAGFTWGCWHKMS